MDFKTFKENAKANDLTLSQMVMLGRIQSAVYHQIKFDGKENRADLKIDLGSIANDRRKMRPVDELIIRGFVKTDNHHDVVVTEKGWSVDCNAGSTIFCGAPTPREMAEFKQTEVVTNFGVNT